MIFPAAASLERAVTDDGLRNPPGGVTTTWSLASGPGGVTFAIPNAVGTTASFSSTGTYVLRLAADDGELVTNDTVTVTVDGEGGGGGASGGGCSFAASNRSGHLPWETLNLFLLPLIVLG